MTPPTILIGSSFADQVGNRLGVERCCSVEKGDMIVLKLKSERSTPFGHSVSVVSMELEKEDGVSVIIDCGDTSIDKKKMVPIERRLGLAVEKILRRGNWTLVYDADDNNDVFDFSDAESWAEAVRRLVHEVEAETDPSKVLEKLHYIGNIAECHVRGDDTPRSLDWNFGDDQLGIKATTPAWCPCSSPSGSSFYAQARWSPHGVDEIYTVAKKYKRTEWLAWYGSECLGNMFANYGEAQAVCEQHFHDKGKVEA